MLILLAALAEGTTEPAAPAATPAPASAPASSPASAPASAPASSPASTPASTPAGPGPEPGLFSRATYERSLAGRTYVLPGVAWASWAPLRRDVADGSRAGVGFELSVAHWVTGHAYVGATTQVEYVGRPRVAVGGQVGYELVGLEVSVARELPGSGAIGQWSLQLAPFVSFGILWVSPRWIVALDRRGAADHPGDGLMFVVGVKLPFGFGKSP